MAGQTCIAGRRCLHCQCQWVLASAQGPQQGIADYPQQKFAKIHTKSLEWQLCSAAAPESRWLIVGQNPLDIETLATTALGVMPGDLDCLMC